MRNGDRLYHEGRRLLESAGGLRARIGASQRALEAAEGESARALDREGVEALGIITGNFNLIDLDPGPADTSMFGQGGGQTGWSAALFASLAFDNAIDERAARTKGIKSPVAGKADILVVPDLEAGNMLAKQLTFMAGAAGIVLGARAPIVLTSRADGPQARLASCAVAVLFAEALRKGAALLKAGG